MVDVGKGTVGRTLSCQQRGRMAQRTALAAAEKRGTKKKERSGTPVVWKKSYDGVQRSIGRDIAVGNEEVDPRGG